jgi:RNA-directed DNA polymerase
MMAALENGVKGGQWFSLIDKVYRVETLKAAWQKVEANAGAAGVDGQSAKRFAARAEMYLKELSIALKRGTYRPMTVRRGDFLGERREASSRDTGSQRSHRTDGA